MGRAHGREGWFWVERPAATLEPGVEVTVAGATHRLLDRGGTADRPLIRLSGIDQREAAAALRGEVLLIEEELGPGEWLAHELVGCEVEGMGQVERVIGAPSCDLLELDDGRLVPLVSEAIRSVDIAGRRIEVDRDFLGAS